MNYTLHQLQVFAKVVQLKSITKAALELHMTQPAVSIQLKNFQDQFEIPLTEVIGRQLYITEFGMEVYSMAERVINEVYAINYKTMAYKGHLSGRLKISVVSTGKYIMPYFLSKFIQENRGVELLMDVTNKTKVIESLKNNEVDFSLVSIIPDVGKVNQEILLDNDLYLIGSGKQKIKGGARNKLQPSESLKDMTLLFREEGSGTRIVMEKYLEKQNVQEIKRMALTSNEAIKQAVIAGLGNSIVPLIGIRNELQNGQLRIIKTAGLPITTQWRLIWLKNKKLSPVSEAYLQFLKENKTAIIKEYFSWMKAV
jgi:LysR family transcriptional regulator, low CO2-responsive transcriptional regulator